MQYQNPFGTTGINVPYVNGNPATGVEGSIIPALAMQEPQTEIVNAITAKGLIPTDADLTQLAQSIGYWIGTFGGSANALSTVLNPLPVSIHAGLIIAGLSSTVPNTGPATLNVGVGGTIALTRSDNTPFVGGEIFTPGQVLAFQYDGTAWRMISPYPSNFFVLVVPTTTWFVDAAHGTDAVGHGFSSGTGAFASIIYAVSTIRVFFSAGGVTINVAAGTYAGVSIGPSLISVWNIIGSGATTCTIDQTSGAGSSSGRGVLVSTATVNITGFLIKAAINGVEANAAAVVEVNNCNFDLCAGSCLVSEGGSRLGIIGSMTVFDSAAFQAWVFASGGTIVLSENSGFADEPLSVTFTNSTFTSATAIAGSGGFIESGGFVTFSGTANGTRFAIGFGEIATVGGGANFFPGTIAGTTTVGIYS